MAGTPEAGTSPAADEPPAPATSPTVPAGGAVPPRPRRPPSSRSPSVGELYAVAAVPPTAVLLQAITAALASQGVPIRSLGSAGPDGDLPVALHEEDVVLVLDELETAADVARVRALVSCQPARCVVLSPRASDLACGALLAAGAAAVRRSSVGLEEMAVLLERVRANEPVDDPATVARLVQGFEQARQRHVQLVQRLGALGPRDRLLLAQLHAGRSVESIAEVLEVEPGSVSGLVAGLTRRLDVPGSAEAVDLLQQLLASEEWWLG
jgi:DNA-binding NarL/FixJ family response regulator